MGSGGDGNGAPVAYLATTLRSEETFERWERHARAHGLVLEDYTAHLRSSGGGRSDDGDNLGNGGGYLWGSSGRIGGSGSSGAGHYTAEVRFLHRSSEEGGGCRIVLTRIAYG